MSNNTIQSKYIHIDSRNRSQVSSLIRGSDIKLGDNPLLFTNNSNQVIIYHVNHGFTNDTLEKKHIIFTNITGDENNLICNYPKNEFEYNSLKNEPIFEIKDIKNSNYYTIHIKQPLKIKLSNIQTGRTGGSNIIINIVKEESKKIYETPNNYKIDLGESSCVNVVGMRLVSTEIPNVAYNIKHTGKNKNNCLHWVNENEGKYISDKIAVSDQIYLNSISKTNLTNANLTNEYPSSPDKFQTNISANVTNAINSSYSNISSYIHITKNKLSQFHTPANLFDTNHFLKNNYHLIGNTLVNYIRTNTNDHIKFKQYLPWEYNYYLQYNNGSDYNTDINYVPDILGYQIFDIKTSTLNNLKFQEYVTENTYVDNNIIPKTNLNGGSFMIENINTNYNFTNTLTLKYPIHSLYLNEGIYNTIDDILSNINYQLNFNKRLTYSWKLRDWVEEKKSNKFVKNKKNHFNIQLNKQTEIIEFRQYEDITNYSSLIDKPINKQETMGKQNLVILTNDGLSEIAIKNKGHMLNTGNLLRINTPENIYNLQAQLINNREHIVKINPVYEIKLRVIYPILSKTYYGIHNNKITNINIPAYQINQTNLGNEYDESNPDTTKILKDYFGEDNFKYLNKGSYQSMLKYIGSKLVATNNESYNTSSENIIIDGPENPFLKNELIVKYNELQGDGHITIGRINKTNSTDSNGNITLQYECLTEVEKGNFQIGDFIVGMNSNCIGMIVPYNWSEQKLPSKLNLTSKINWKRQIQQEDENIAVDITTDLNGNVYVIGYTEGEIDTPSSTNSNKDIIILKYNSSGKELWKKQIGPADEDKGYALKVDNTGNFYVLGTSKGEIITGTANIGNEDIYLAKYDASGNVLWEVQIATTDVDIGYDLELDSNSNIYIVGTTKNNLDGNVGNTIEDIVVAKYNTSGTQQWIQQYGTARIDIGSSITIDYLDNIYITGHTVNTDGNYDIIIKKLSNSDGNVVWEKTIASSNYGEDYSYGITTDNMGYIYISGYTSGNLISPLSSFNKNDFFIAKYLTSDGNQVWIRQFGSYLHDETSFSSSITSDNYGNVYLCGHTKGNLEINNKNSVTNDLFIMKVNSDGEELWKEQIGTSNDDKNVSITIDLYGNIYIAGTTKGDLGVKNNLTKLGSEYDLFIIKMYSDATLPIKEIKNGSENITIQIPSPINKTDINGLSINNLTIQKPIRFSILWGAKNTLQKQLGFLNNKQGKSVRNNVINTKIYEEDLRFEYVNSNTKDINEVVITRSTFFNFYNDNDNNYLLLECEKTVPYEIGDRVYIKDHLINYYQQKQTLCQESIIQSIYPFSNWLYSLESEKKSAAQATITITESDLTGGVSGSGLVTFTNVDNLTGEVSASSTITVTNSSNLLDTTLEQITIISTNSTTVTLTASITTTGWNGGGILTSDGGSTTNTLKPFSNEGSNAGFFLVDTNSNNNTATNIKNLIDSHSEFTAIVSNNIVTITQNTTGSDGNTTIAINHDIIQEGTNPNPSGDYWVKRNSEGNSDGWTDANPPAYEDDEEASLINILTGDKIQANKLYTLSFTIAVATLNLQIGGGDLSGNLPSEIYVEFANYDAGSHTVTFTPVSAASHLWITGRTDSAGNGTINNISLVKDGLTNTDFTGGVTGDTIELVTTDGTSIKATVTPAISGTTTTTDTDTPKFMIGADVDATATNLATCLNANSKLTASASNDEVTITQVTLGASGNTTITLTDSGDAGMTKTDFTGGITGDTIEIITSDATILTVFVTPNGGTTTNSETNVPKFAIVTGDDNSTAANLNTCLNAHSKLSTSVSSNVVTITQTIIGSKGNTEITTTNAGGGDGIVKTNFTGGGYGNATQTTISLQVIEKIKQWLYNNLSKIALDDDALLGRIVNQYYYSNNQIYKMYVQETHGDGFHSKAFQKNMSLYDINNGNSLIGTVVGISKINTTVDRIYNEAEIKDINDIKKDSYYFIYFVKDSNYDLTNLKTNDVVTFNKNKKQIESIDITTNIITITSHGFENNECVIYDKVGGNSIGGLINGNQYFIINKTTNTFQLSLTNDGFTQNQQNSVLTLSSVTVSLASGSITDGTYTIIQSSTDGSGSGFICSAVFSSNTTTAITILNGGSNYTAGNTITFTNLNNETNSLVITIDTVGPAVINGGNAINLTLADADTGHLLDTLRRSITREASAIVNTFPTTPYNNIIQNGSNPGTGNAGWTVLDNDGGTDGWNSSGQYQDSETSALINEVVNEKLLANIQYSLSFRVSDATLKLKIGIKSDNTGLNNDTEVKAFTDYEVGTHTILFTPTIDANYLWITANTDSGGMGTISNITTSPLYLDARYDYLYYFYFAKKVIVDYKTDMTDKEVEYLGNNGYLGNNSIDLNRDVDINYNLLPLNTVKPGEHIYIYNHQKAVPKYFEELDVLDTNPKLIETIQNDYDESILKTSVDETNNYNITGIPDGTYKALINLWPGSKENPYLNHKYRPGKTVLLDLDWNQEIEEGYMNKGSMRTLNSGISIVGDNKKVENTAEISTVIKTVDTNTVTDTNTKGDSKILVSSVTNFSVNSLIFINTKTYENNIESEYSNKINVDTCEMNIITDIDIPSNVLTLKYPLINNHNYSDTMVIQRYTTSFVTTSSANEGQKNIVIGNSEYANFSIGDIIILDWNTKDGDGNYIEEIHRISAKPGSDTLTVEENLLYTHTTNCCVVNLGNTSIRDTMLSTQNILINNEWYTKVFYQGHDCIEPNGNEEYKTGVPCFHKYCRKKVYINGMNGIQIPDMSLMLNRDTAYSQQNKIDNTSEIDSSLLIQENFNINQIKPLTAGFYETYPNLLRDKVSLLTDYYNLTIPGNFSVRRKNFSSELIWNENPTYQSIDNLEYNCILIKGKYLGYGGKIEFREEKSILENPNGFKVLQKISDTNQNLTKILIDLKISDINLNTKSVDTQKSFNNLIYNNQVPSSVLINNYNTLKTKTFLKQDITIGTGGYVYTKVKNGAINLSGENYINLCFPNLGGKQSDNKQTIMQTSDNLNKNVFAKILLPDNSGNILFNTFVSSPTIFQNPIPKLSNLFVKFIDNDGNEYDFQGKDHSFTLEVFYKVLSLTN